MQTTGTIYSPIDVGRSAILYSSSPLTKGSDGRTRALNHDFYLLREGAEPKRLSNFNFYLLNSLNLAGSTLMFTAFGPSASGSSTKNPITPAFDPVAAISSEIFALEMDLPEYQIRIPSQALQPLFLIGGVSTFPSVSTNGKYVAFRNRRITAGRTRFNLGIATSDGRLLKYIESAGQAAFVGDRVLANELLDDRYEVKEFDVSGDDPKIVFRRNYSTNALNDMERIHIAN